MYMSSVILITYSNYPNGSASAIRYANFAATLTDMEYEVIVFCKSSSNPNKINNIHVESFTNVNKYHRLFLFPYRAIKRLKQIMLTKKISGVLLGSDLITLHAYQIQKWCNSNGINCVFDTTEWYSKEQFNNWIFSFPYWDKTILNKCVITKQSRVIAISSFLYDYFKAKGAKVVKVPIFYNRRYRVTPFTSREIQDYKIKIIYAGSHLLMDNIPLIVKAIALLPHSIRSKVEFVIYGLSQEQIKSCLPQEILAEAKDALVIKGQRPNCEVIEAYQSADYSIVLRNPSLRVNKAGFPSKVVESMRLGVPVICNYSSDLDKYIISGFNGIIIDNLCAEAISNQIRILTTLTREEKLIMGRNAIDTVDSKLNSRLFEMDLNTILN